MNYFHFLTLFLVFMLLLLIAQIKDDLDKGLYPVRECVMIKK